MLPPSLTQWEPVGLAVPAPFLRADGAEAMSSAPLASSQVVRSAVEPTSPDGQAWPDRQSAPTSIASRPRESSARRESPSRVDGADPRIAWSGAGLGFVLVAGLGVHGARLAVADLGQRLLAQETFSVQLSGPKGTLALIAERWRDMLSAVPCPPDRVRTIAVGLPGPVDRSTGTPVRPPLMPGWDAFPVGQVLRDRFGCHVLVNNDANLMALGEARALPPSQYPLVFIKVSTGSGAESLAPQANCTTAPMVLPATSATSASRIATMSSAAAATSGAWRRSPRRQR